MTTTYRTTKIQWTQHTWNPIRGCTPVSSGCDNCYAEKMAKRFRKPHQTYGRHFEPTMYPDRLEEPLRWKKPRLIFVGSMGDLFHEKISNHFIAKVYNVMARTPHIYQVLTKRTKRMLDLVNWFVKNRGGPFENIWHGATIEDQPMVNLRLPDLLNVKSVLHYVSCEPLLGDVFLGDALEIAKEKATGRIVHSGWKPELDWVIVGGETGPGARECREEWIENLWLQCKQSSVPFFFKGKGRKWKNADNADWKTKTADEIHADLCRAEYGEAFQWEDQREWPARITL